MNARWHDCDQRGDEWRALRCGKVTASRIGDLMARTKTGYGASRANYASELVLERLTGAPVQGYTNAAMQFGIDTEPEARRFYCLMTDASVSEVGFIEHPTIPMAGYSPDGYIGEDGLLEIKCPQPAAHLETLLSQEIADKYIKQMQFGMASAERAWCDFVSYQPAFPTHMRLFSRRVVRDDKLITEIEREVISFLQGIDDTVSRLRARYELRDAA